MRELEEVPLSKKREKANLSSIWQLWVYNNKSICTMPTLTTTTEWMKIYRNINFMLDVIKSGLELCSVTRAGFVLGVRWRK